MFAGEKHDMKLSSVSFISSMISFYIYHRSLFGKYEGGP